MALVGKGNPVDLRLGFLEPFMAQITFGPGDMHLMGQLDGPFGVTFPAGGLVALMAGEAVLHSGPVGFRGHLVMHNIIVAEGALPVGDLYVKLMGNDDFQRVMLEGVDFVLLHVPMAAQAVGIGPLAFRLVIAGNPFFMAGMTLGAIDLGVDQRFFQKRNLVLPGMAGQAVLGPGGGKVGQAQEKDCPQNEHTQDQQGYNPVGQVKG